MDINKQIVALTREDPPTDAEDDPLGDVDPFEDI